MTAGERPRIVWPAPTTQLAGVVGFPARHSLSPRLQNAAFAVMGLDWCYLAFEVPPGSLDKAVAGAAALGFRGLSVTMPHKDAAARLATRHSRQVRRLGAANTLIFEAGSIRAESCDGDGLVDDLREGAGFDPEGRRCGVIGAGGAGRAAVLALAEAGAAEIIVVNRTAARAWRSVALAPKLAHVGRPDELKGVDLVIQATPSGMPRLAEATKVRPGGSSRPGPNSGEASRQSGPNELDISPTDIGLSSPAALRQMGEVLGRRQPSRDPAAGSSTHPQLFRPAQMTLSHGEAAGASTAGKATRRPKVASPGSGPGEAVVVAGVDPRWFGPGQLVVDLVYDPPRTPFLLEAERNGATVRNGLGMLVNQAARQIRLWTGLEPPLQVMWAVVGGDWLELPETR
jgi:shikimate dehydrogenase